MVVGEGTQICNEGRGRGGVWGGKEQEEVNEAKEGRGGVKK